MASPSFSRTVLPWLAVAGILLAAFGIWISLPDRAIETPDKTPVTAAKANDGNGVPGGAQSGGVVASGVVEPSSEITDIGTNVSGIVTRLYVQIGERVAQGQPLFAVDSRQVSAAVREAETGIGEARAGIAAAQAGMAEARINMATAQRQLALYRNVDDARAISRAEVIAAEGVVSNARARMQAAEAQRAAAQAQLTAAQARRSSAMTELARHTVYAPISGEVLDVEIRNGEFVSAGGPAGGNTTPYIQLGETQPLYVRVDVDENEAARIADNASAIISPRGNAALRVPVTFVRIEPQIVPKRSLTNSASERVDVRVMQIIFALPPGTADSRANFRVGQQIDAVIMARPAQANRP